MSVETGQLGAALGTSRGGATVASRPRGAAPPSAAVLVAAAAAASGTGDLPVHLAARTVLMRCPNPLSELEVAVVLETCGYNSSRVRSAGGRDLMELAREVYRLVPVYAPAPGAGPLLAPHPPSGGSPRGRRALVAGLENVGAFCKGLIFSAPLVVSLATMLIAGVSLWSSAVALPSIANSVTMATSLALVSTGPFIHAFGRRASFYLGFHDEGMVAYLTRRALGTGMVVASVTCLVAYFLRADISGSGALGADRLGLAAGLAIAALQLGLAPFYVRNAFVPMAVIVGGAGGVLVWHVLRMGGYIDPVDLAVWQVRLVTAMASLTWLVDGWWLLRTGRAREANRRGTVRRLWVPSGRAVARAVAPYGAFGFAYFCLVSLPQLVSGGAWLGRYGFNGSFSLASGLALVGLVPVAGFGTVAAERLMHRVLPATLAGQPIRSVPKVREALRRHWRAQLAWASLAGAGTAATIDAVVPGLGHDWLLAKGLQASPWLLYACSAGFFFFAIGTFASTLLFSLSSPGLALAGAWAGTLVLLGLSAVLSIPRLTTLSAAAASGFVAGTAIFAAVAVWAGERAFSNVDLTCYRSL